MAKFIGQLFSWIATDVIVKGLSNSRTFQRVVLKVDKFQTTAEKFAEEKAEEVLRMTQEGKAAAENIARERTAAAAEASKQKIKEHSTTLPESVADLDVFEQLEVLKAKLEKARASGDFEQAAKLMHADIPEVEQAIKAVNERSFNVGGVNVNRFLHHLKKEFKQ